MTKLMPVLRVKEEATERRKDKRYSCFLRAQIVSSDGQISLACTAYDISAHGMRLRDCNFRTVPNFFLLRVPRRHLEVFVEVMRRQSDELGVRFVNATA